MNCNQTRELIRTSAEAPRKVVLDEHALAHLAECELCRHWRDDFMLERVLAAYEVPAPSDGFVDRVIDRAAAAQLSTQPLRFAVAAAIAVVAIAVGVMVAPILTGDAAETRFEVALRPNDVRTVDVMIDAAEARSGATLTVALADALELGGFGSERVISWQTDLDQGKNLLPLPIVLTQAVDTYFDVRLEHEAGNQTLRIDVKPAVDVTST